MTGANPPGLAASAARIPNPPNATAKATTTMATVRARIRPLLPGGNCPEITPRARNCKPGETTWLRRSRRLVRDPGTPRLTASSERKPPEYEQRKHRQPEDPENREKPPRPADPA